MDTERQRKKSRKMRITLFVQGALIDQCEGFVEMQVCLEMQVRLMDGGKCKVYNASSRYLLPNIGKVYLCLLPNKLLHLPAH